jgi:hypothetical protein
VRHVGGEAAHLLERRLQPPERLVEYRRQPPHDGGPARAFGAFHDGRLAVLLTFDTDLGDGLEDEGIHNDPPEKREAALRMAINIVLHTLTQ